MAIVRLGPIVGGISGALGGVVFVNSKRSLVARRPPTTRRKSSPFLARSRSRMAQLRNHWHTLTTNQQTRWSSAASQIESTNALGLSSPISGFEYFIKTNKVAFPGAFGLVDEPSSIRARDFAVNPTVAFSATTGYDVSIDNPSAPLFLQIQVYGWPFWLSHETKSVPRLVFLDERSASADPVQDNVQPEWRAHFGDMVEGQRFSCGIKARASASPFNPITIIQSTVTA